MNHLENVESTCFYLLNKNFELCKFFLNKLFFYKKYIFTIKILIKNKRLILI